MRLADVTSLTLTSVSHNEAVGIMLQNPMAAGRPTSQYQQGFGTPGNVGMNIGGGQGIPMSGQAQGQRGRQRAVSNINMQQAPEGYQTQPHKDPSISQWQSGVLASQGGSAQQAPQVVDQRLYAGYGGAPSQETAFAETPEDPGSKPNFDGLNLKSKEKKIVMEHWQKRKDKFDEYYATQAKSGQKRSRSQGRYQDQNTAAFPSGYNSNPASDIERTMNRLSLGPNNTAAAQRQAERGRRLSGGALGLSGSAAQREAAQAAYAAQQQQEQMRMMRERSRSRQPFDRNPDDMGGRPAYMPVGGGNINSDPMLGNATQPSVIPKGYNIATGGQQGASRAANVGQYNQGGVSPIVNPYAFPQPSPQQPQVSPALFGQALPQMVSSMDQSQMVPVQTVGGVMTMGIPVGHINQYPALFNQMQPGVSPLPSPIDGSNMAPFLTPSMYAQQIPAEQPRRKHNITEVTNSAPYQAPMGSGYAAPNPKTFINPGAPPPKPHTVNINSYTTAQSRGAPSGYVVSAAPPQQPSLSSTNAYSGAQSMGPASSGSSGERTSASMASYQTSQRPPLTHNETSSTVGLTQATGPAGFGNRPNHTRMPSYQTALRETGQTQTPDSGSGRGDKVPVSMRRPNSRMQVRNFPPMIISFDLNSEHRQPAPLRFGRFVYDRDVTHEEWEVFTKQLLDAWSERDPGFNRYHSAVRRINAILSAWNYAFFNPRGMDIVLFKGNERRSGGRYGQPEPNLEFLEEAGPVSDAEDESSDEEDDDSENPAYYLQQQDPNYRARIEREKAAIKAYRREEKRRESAARPLEAPHALVVYEVPMPGESYR